MFTAFDDPSGHFSFSPLPAKFFLDQSPFGGGALLVLNKFDKNSTSTNARHGMGIARAVAQVISAFGPQKGLLEVYGISDRTGSESINLTISAARARNALAQVKGALGLSDFNMTSSAGLGERFADEYFQDKDLSNDANMRGVACYFWESISVAQDPVLVLSIKFATPPKGNTMLGPLFLGRFRSSPPSPFA